MSQQNGKGKKEREEEKWREVERAEERGRRGEERKENESKVRTHFLIRNILARFISSLTSS